MMRSLTRPRLTRVQLAVVAALSAGATALILVAASGRTAVQSAALAALQHRAVVESAAGATAAGVTASADAPLNTAAAPPAPAASTTTQSAAASSTAPVGNSGSGGSSTTTAATTTRSNTPSGPRADHVFVIALSSTSFDAAFGPGSAARYLNTKLKPQGTLLGGYESLGAGGFPDYLAMISGQAPNPDTRASCATYSDFPTAAKPDAAGLVGGTGCVYPNTVLTIGDQVTVAGHIWRAYVGGIGSTACPHPDSGVVDDTEPRGAGSLYSDRHNPFIYFHSLLDLGGCASNDVSLSELPRDLARSSSTPAFAYITPDGCAEASAVSCPGGGKTGLAAEDAFLKQWVPRITGSQAYKQHGALLITFAPPIGRIGTVPAPDEPIPTGALVLSASTPRNQIVSAVYNPYSVLRVLDELLGYKPLGMAANGRSFLAKAFRSS